MINSPSKVRLILEDGKPQAVILGLAYYEKLLELAEDAEDLREIRKLRRLKQSFIPLKDYHPRLH